jgi:hypothetical protein
MISCSFWFYFENSRSKIVYIFLERAVLCVYFQRSTYALVALSELQHSYLKTCYGFLGGKSMLHVSKHRDFIWDSNPWYSLPRGLKQCIPPLAQPPGFTLTRSLTHGAEPLLDKPPILQLFKNFQTFYGTRRFIATFTRALHWSLYWARSIQSIPSHPISPRSSLILSPTYVLVFPVVGFRLYTLLIKKRNCLAICNYNSASLLPFIVGKAHRINCSPPCN